MDGNEREGTEGVEKQPVQELSDDVAKIARRMREALRRDVCAKLNAQTSDARHELHQRLVTLLPQEKSRRMLDALCAGGVTHVSLAADPALAEAVDSGAIVEPLLDIAGGLRRSFLSLQTAWEHLAEWRDAPGEDAAASSSEWQLLASLGMLGLPVEVKRPAVAELSPWAIEVTRVCATPADTASFVTALRARASIVPPEGGAAVEDLLVLVDPDVPRASRLALSSILMKEAYTSLVHCRKLHGRSDVKMHLALHAHALFNVVQPPARSVRREDLEAHMRRQFLGRAYQCAQCSFGPIDHFACGDLAHHNGERAGSAVVNNACPRCSWFSRTLADWPKWDGTVPEEALMACARPDEEPATITAACAEIALRICYSARAFWDPGETGEPHMLCSRLADWETLTSPDGVEHPVQLLIALAVVDELPESIFRPVAMAQLLNEVCSRKADDELRRVGSIVGRRRVGAFLGVSYFTAPQPSRDYRLERQRAAVLEECSADYAIDPDAFDFKSWVKGVLTPWAHAILFARRLRGALGRRAGGWRRLARDMEAGPSAYADIIAEMQRPAESKDSPAALLGVRRKEDAQRVLATVAAQAFLHHSPESRRTKEFGGLLDEPLGDVCEEETLRGLCIELRMSYYDEAIVAKQRAREEMFRKLASTGVHSLSKQDFWSTWQQCYAEEERRMFFASANQGFVDRHGGEQR